MREQVRRADARHDSARVARAAIAVLSEKGPAASLDDIARRAGIGIATVYRRFGDRDGVIRAALSAYVAETVEPRLRGARDGGDAGRALTEALAATVALLAARHGLLAARGKGRDRPVPVVDSVGVGGGVVDRLRELRVPVLAFTGSAGTRARTRDGEFSFNYTRSAAYWQMRELLDPAFVRRSRCRRTTC
ncbi:TetR/AcrR family transcriptional regulator [Nonomuraea terrae]|uniref:TetR/AcrR family transcriptional regulator n=1 Tax=Nonomuraea terrae TaxID=2530383 RepID=A0A4R4XNX7_9ACTN|nr:helix-turn-helix domain-containing protein [Nonomuraea terrae]TDD32760.1 TetR/AcrR family transcriptional regulator [Nonomuraea terrae]